MATKTPITVAHGDGIGPDIMAASLHILEEAGASLDIDTIEIGERVFLRGHKTGIEPESWESLRRTKVLYRAPVTMPQGGGFQRLSVTTRNTLGLYANVRRCVSYHPFVRAKHEAMDVVIIRENEEDLHAGIEYQLSPNLMQSIRLISRPGSERIVRYAFEYARQHKRKKVACFTKDSVLKMSDGLFHRVFDEISEEYPDIQREHWNIESGAAKLATKPETFDVVVTPNLYGDILAEVAAQIAGPAGLAGASNFGTHAAVFEATHGSAPRRAGQNIANPSGLLLGGVSMLVHIGQPDVAERVHNAWMKTLEDGVHTEDIHTEGVSRERAGTKEFAAAVVARLGQKPETLKPAQYEVPQMQVKDPVFAKASATLIGVDVYAGSPARDTNALAEAAAKANGAGLALQLIDNRGIKVWPEGGQPEPFCLDSYRLRFVSKDNMAVSPHQITALLDRCAYAGIEVVKAEYLRLFDGQPGYSL